MVVGGLRIQYCIAQHSTVQDASRQRVNARQLWRVPPRAWCHVWCQESGPASSIILSGLDSDSSPRWSPSIRTSSQLSHLRLPYFTSNFCEAADRALAPQVTTPPNRPRRCWGRLPPPESWRRWSTRRAVGSFPFVKPFRFVWSSAGRSHAAALS